MGKLSQGPSVPARPRDDPAPALGLPVDPSILLADEIATGNYTPSSFSDCTSNVTLDQSPQVFRFTQFALVRNPPDRHGPGLPTTYLSLQLPLLGQPERGSTRLRQIEAIARRSAERLFTADPISRLPAAEAQRAADIRTAMYSRNPGSSTAVASPLDLALRPELSSTDEEIVQIYTDWRRSRLASWVTSALAPTAVPGLVRMSDYPESPSKHPVEMLSQGLVEAVVPGPFQPLTSPSVLFALCVTYRQVWATGGYTRGELVAGFSLAPGEQLTVDFHSWDKSTFKSETELAEESELRASAKLTQRDSLSTIQELSRKDKDHIDANLGVAIKWFSFGLTGSDEREFSQRTQDTREHLAEGTAEASQSLKVNRKLHIEVSREAGREDRQTQVLQNTNRCHSIDFRYFEIVSNYMVATYLESARPCLLLQNKWPTITPEWVICYEDIIRKVLLDSTFLPGFDAARQLAVRQVFANLLLPAVGATLDPGPERSATLIRAILDTYHRLTDAVAAYLKAVHFLGDPSDPATWVVATGFISPDVMPRVIYWGGLTSPAAKALDQLQLDFQNYPAIDALRALFRAVPPEGFQPLLTPANIAESLKGHGWLAAGVDALLAAHILDKPGDGVGLDVALRATSDALGLTAGPTAPISQAATDPAQAQALMQDLESRATAQVTFDQLKCHIEANLSHYSQAVWAQEDPDQRAARLSAYPGILDVVDNELLGFMGNRGAYPIHDLTAVEPWIDFAPILKQAQSDVDNQQVKLRLLTLPAPGTVLQAVVSECYGCEEYIAESRSADLRMQAAKARQEELEAKRREERLAAQPPDLSDPNRPPGNQIAVRLDRSFGATAGASNEGEGQAADAASGDDGAT